MSSPTTPLPGTPTWCDPTNGSALFNMLTQNDYNIFFNALRSFRNGVVYGTRVRAPHALVLNMVWSKASPSTWPRKILHVTLEHALGLGLSGVILAVVRALLSYLNCGRTALWHHTVGGFLVGSLVWGNSHSAVHLQMMMYMLSRMVCAIYHLVAERVHFTAPSYAYRVYAGLLWACTITMLMYRPSAIQPSMRQSLEYIFLDVRKFSSLANLITGR